MVDLYNFDNDDKLSKTDKITGSMAEVAKRKSTLDKHALRKIAHRLQEGYSRQAIYEEMKQEYSEVTQLANRIAGTPNLEQVVRHHRLLNSYKGLLAVLLGFKLLAVGVGLAGNLEIGSSNEIIPFSILALLIPAYGYILFQFQKLTNGTKPFWSGLYLITGLVGWLILFWDARFIFQISEAISIPPTGTLSFLLLNLGIVIAAIVVAVKLKRRLFPHLQELSVWDYHTNPGKIFRKNQNIADNTKTSSGAS